jgi:hypothetical protein
MPRTLSDDIERNRMKSLILALALLPLVGCDSGRDAAKLQEDERNLATVAQAEQDGLQWKLDDAVAVGIFDESHYLTFRKCHEEPPTHDANRKVCAALQARVAKQEAKNGAQSAKDKAAW